MKAGYRQARLRDMRIVTTLFALEFFVLPHGALFVGLAIGLEFGEEGVPLAVAAGGAFMALARLVELGLARWMCGRSASRERHGALWEEFAHLASDGVVPWVTGNGFTRIWYRALGRIATYVAVVVFALLGYSEAAPR